MNVSPLTRRRFARMLGSGAWAASVASSRSFAGPPESRKPNVILILADDLGFGDLRCFRGTYIRTPHLDALARRGMRFYNFHSNSPVDGPPRAALLTGRYPQRFGLEGETGPGRSLTGQALPPGEFTFVRMLKKAGYPTALFGKWFLGGAEESRPLRQGFDEFRGFLSESIDYHSHLDIQGARDWWINDRRSEEKGYVTDLITQHGIRFMEQHRAEPFCLFLSHAAAHYPYQGKKDEAYRKPGDAGPAEGVREDQANAYREMVEALDASVGRVMESLKQLGLENDTFLFFCSDNGARVPGSNAHLSGGKGMLREGGIRVPAIAFWPGRVRANMILMEAAMGIDFLPTVAEACGCPLPDDLRPDGISLWPALGELKSLPKRALFWRHGGRRQRERAVIRDDWKLYLTPQKPYLFNLGFDISEGLNFYESRSDLVAQLQKELQAWEKDVDRK